MSKTKRQVSLVAGRGRHPTSVKGMDCWLSFCIVEFGVSASETYIDHVHAVRSGRGEHEYDVYVWENSENMWISAPHDEEDE